MVDIDAKGRFRSRRCKGWRGIAPLLLASMTSVAGCASADTPAISVAQANTQLERDYRIANGDEIKVTVFDEPNLTGQYMVGLDGGLQLPLIGTIPAAGLTSPSLSDAIATALKSGGYVLSPRVAVEVTQHQPFFILGEVKTPGEYAYASDMTLEQAVAKAGGFTPRANKSTIILRREDWSSARRVHLSHDALKILPGDTITVQEALF